MQISYEKTIPYPFETVLSQYFDYEHIAHVHPKTLGEYRLIDSGEGFIRYEHLWPRRWTGQKRSIVRHSFSTPNEMWFTFEEGYLKGTEVHSLLEDLGQTTRITETYSIPIPDWKWLRPLVLKWTLKKVDRIWKEDLDVEVCRKGWPGVPESILIDASHLPELAPLSCPRAPVGTVQDFPPGKPVRVEVDGKEVLILNDAGKLIAVSNLCPHTGGPFHLGRIAGNEVVCPWHGARFDLETGKLLSGPPCENLRVYRIVLDAAEVFIQEVPRLSS